MTIRPPRVLAAASARIWRSRQDCLAIEAEDELGPVDRHRAAALRVRDRVIDHQLLCELCHPKRPVSRIYHWGDIGRNSNQKVQKLDTCPDRKDTRYTEGGCAHEATEDFGHFKAFAMTGVRIGRNPLSAARVGRNQGEEVPRVAVPNPFNNVLTIGKRAVARSLDFIISGKVDAIAKRTAPCVRARYVADLNFVS